MPIFLKHRKHRRQHKHRCCDSSGTDGGNTVFPTHRLIWGDAPQIQHRPPHMVSLLFILFIYLFFNAIEKHATFVKLNFLSLLSLSVTHASVSHACTHTQSPPCTQRLSPWKPTNHSWKRGRTDAPDAARVEAYSSSATFVDYTCNFTKQ